MDATCPNCGGLLATKPSRKKKCPHCGKYIYVRQGQLVGENHIEIRTTYRDQPQGQTKPQKTQAKNKSNSTGTVFIVALVAIVLCCSFWLANSSLNRNDTQPQPAAEKPIKTLSTATAAPKPTSTLDRNATVQAVTAATIQAVLDSSGKKSQAADTLPALNSVSPEPTLDDLADVPDIPTSTSTPVAPLVEAEKDVNLRTGPGTDYPVMGGLSTGQSFEIIGRSADSSWWQVSTDDGPAWVAASVVKASNADRAIQIVDAPPPPTPTLAPATSTPLPAPTPTTVIVIPTPAPASDHPADATARCNDGSFSFSVNHRGTCSHHGGVAVWYK